MDPNLQSNIQGTQQLVNLNSSLIELLKDQQDLMRSINNELNNKTNITKEVRKQYNALESIADKLVDDQEDLLDLSQRQLEKEKAKAEIALSRLKTAATQLKLEIDSGEKDLQAINGKKKLTTQERILLQAAEEGFKIETETVNLIKQRLDLQKRVNKDIGLFGATVKSIENLTKKIGLSGIDDVFKDARKASEEKAKALIEADAKVSSIKVNLAAAGASMGILAKGIGSALMDPMFLITAQVAILKKGFDLYKGVNQAITEQGRQLGISYDQSRKLYHSAIDYSLSQKDIYATEARITEGRKMLNEALGTSIMFSNEQSLEAKKLSEYYGLGAQAQYQMMMNSVRAGKTLTETKNEILKTAVIQKAQYGGTLSYQQVMQKVNAVSGEILTKFKGNIPALTAAVQQADRLGLTLEQVEKTSESLLNWESSIENELKAELLTGKAINLEKARAAALSGNQVELMNEMARQIGSIHEFEKMNVIQRKAYAEAFGMSAAEMGDMLRKREFESKFGKIEQENAQAILDKAKAEGATIDDTIKKQLEQLSLQERIKDVITKIQSILKRITEGPFASLGNFIEKVLIAVEKIMKAFSSLSGGISGNALGALLIAAPTILLGYRLLAGFGKALIYGPRGSSPANPMFVTTGMGPGGPGGMGGAMAAPAFWGMGGASSKLGGQGWMKDYRQYRQMGGSRLDAFRTANQYNKWGMGARMAGGMGLGMLGMGLSTAASGMEEGGAKDTMGVLGSTAQFAGMGMMFGPWGAAIGGLVGLGVGLFNLSKENEERRKQEAEQKRQSDIDLKKALDNMSLRPQQLVMNGETVAKWNTYSNRDGASPWAA